VLGLREQVRGDVNGVGGGVGNDHDLRRPGWQVDAALAEDLELGRGYPRVAGADDTVDGLDSGLGQAVGKGAHGLSAAGDDELIHAGEPRRTQERLVQHALGIRRRSHRHRPHARHPGRHHAHEKGTGVGRGSARRVHPDACQRHPAPLDLDARNDGRRPRLG
jgi:hypothetical protein